MSIARDTNAREQRQTPHAEDPNRPGWCVGCGAAYPCPGTATAAQQLRIMSRYLGGGRR